VRHRRGPLSTCRRKPSTGVCGTSASSTSSQWRCAARGPWGEKCAPSTRRSASSILTGTVLHQPRVLESADRHREDLVDLARVEPRLGIGHRAHAGHNAVAGGGARLVELAEAQHAPRRSVCHRCDRRAAPGSCRPAPVPPRLPPPGSWRSTPCSSRRGGKVKRKRASKATDDGDAVLRPSRAAHLALRSKLCRRMSATMAPQQDDGRIPVGQAAPDDSTRSSAESPAPTERVAAPWTWGRPSCLPEGRASGSSVPGPSDRTLVELSILPFNVFERDRCVVALALVQIGEKVLVPTKQLNLSGEFVHPAEEISFPVPGF